MALWRPRDAYVAAMVAVTMLTLIGAAGCSSKSDEQAVPTEAQAQTTRNVALSKPQLEHVRLVKVGSSTYNQSIDTTGVVDYDNDQATSVLAPFSGPVSRLLVSIGDIVTKGQALAVVDSADFAEAISSYRKARASAATARRLADQDKDLLAHQGVSRREQEQAETDAVGAEADRDATLQALVALNVDAATLKAVRERRSVSHFSGTIRAPISGTVVEKSITPGQLLQAGSTPCFTVADLSRVWVQAQIFGSDLDAVRVGDPASVQAGIGTKPLPGKIININATVDPDSRSVGARILVDNPDGVLKKQMYVRVSITSQQTSSGMLVPESAILRDDENLPFVYVAQPDGSFARSQVTLGDRVGDQQAIADGLHDGDKLVADGAIFVQFMQDQ